MVQSNPSKQEVSQTVTFTWPVSEHSLISTSYFVSKTPWWRAAWCWLGVRALRYRWLHNLCKVESGECKKVILKTTTLVPNIIIFCPIYLDRNQNGPPLLSRFVYTLHPFFPAAPGSNLKHAIFAFSWYILSILPFVFGICCWIVKLNRKLKINKILPKNWKDFVSSNYGLRPIQYSITDPLI